MRVQVRFKDDHTYTLEVTAPSGTPVRSYKRVIPPYLELRYWEKGAWKKPGGHKVIYTAPFGETPWPTFLRVRHKRDPGIAACLRIFGVTGKVVIARACP